jgi:hypothetical protein
VSVASSTNTAWSHDADDVFGTHSLVRLGMLEEDHPDDSRRIYYERTDSPLWKIMQAAARVIEAD